MISQNADLLEPSGSGGGRSVQSAPASSASMPTEVPAGPAAKRALDSIATTDRYKDLEQIITHAMQQLAKTNPTRYSLASREIIKYDKDIRDSLSGGKE